LKIINKNICIIKMDLSEFIFIVEHDKYRYFKEYLESINAKVRFFPCNVKKDEKIIMVQKILDVNYKNASFIGILNTEQLSKKEWLDNFNSIDKEIFKLFDYSKCNIKYIEDKYGFSYKHLPYKYNKKEINLLKKLLLNTVKTYDLAFIGESIEKRGDYIRFFTNKGIKINVINKWGEERDKEVAKCKVLLNIHFREDYQIFEELRCVRWLMAGMVVISEESLNQSEISYQENLIIFKNENFLEEVCKYFKKI